MLTLSTPVHDLVESLNWTKLNERWKVQLLIVVFKCLQGWAPSYLRSHFRYTESLHNKGTWSQTSKSLVVPHWKKAIKESVLSSTEDHKA